MVDNFRFPQPLSPETRTIYRSPAATGTCNLCTHPGSTTCAKVEPRTKMEYVFDTTTHHHWSYADQDHWDEYESSSSIAPHKHNECFHEPHTGTYPGESPIDINPAETVVSAEPSISLSGFSVSRPGLSISNNGHSVTMTVCGTNKADCQATANFGTWPKTIRGINSQISDDYYLAQLHFHWGRDNTKGSEHEICGNSRAAEMHMVFINKRSDVSNDRSDPDSGTKLAVIGTFIEGGRADDNPAYAPILNAIASNAKFPGLYGAGAESVVLSDLLPEDASTKFFTYPGSLTTPPCSQQVTWFNLENYVTLSNAQLELLRDAQTTAVGSQIFLMGGHQTFKAVLFPFFAIFIGTATLHLLTKYCTWLPYTVAVMSEGMLFSYLLSLKYGNNASSDPEILVTYDSLKLSTDMWAQIDGHVLLYAFLPALLFGDAMGLNFHIFQQSFSQCLLLACPGVLLGTVLTGSAAYALLPWGWSWDLCMVFGSILAATDPVAVVTMLKELGASPKLTMQITGEALMNDGTAMVLFNLFWAIYNNNRGYLYRNPFQIMKFFLRMSVAGPLLGALIGFGAVIWIELASKKHSHTHETIQIAITMIAAYISFFLGESESGVSGVLCCIACALVLAANVWPLINSRESMENVWHALEFLGNTVLFFLAGVITQRAVVAFNDGQTAIVEFTARDYGNVFLFFVVMTGIRAFMILVCYPLLKKIGGGTTPKDSCFMVWAGLRGAVGLSLALLVLQSGGDQRVGKQFVFMIGGLAFLTLVIQGITCGPFLENLGMLGVPGVKDKLLETVQRRIEETSQQEYTIKCSEMKHEAEEAIMYMQNLRGLAEDEKEDEFGHGDIEVDAGHEVRPAEAKNMALTNHAEVAEEDEDAFTIPALAAVLQDLKKQGQRPDPDRLSMIRETMLRIVRAEYWEMIESGHLPGQSPAAQILLGSIDIALDEVDKPLSDIHIIMETMEKSLRNKVGDLLVEVLGKVALAPTSSRQLGTNFSST